MCPVCAESGEVSHRRLRTALLGLRLGNGESSRHELIVAYAKAREYLHRGRRKDGQWRENWEVGCSIKQSFKRLPVRLKVHSHNTASLPAGAVKCRMLFGGKCK